MTFRREDYVQAVEAAKAAGLKVHRTEIHPDGRIVIHHQDDAEEETWEEFRGRQAKEDEATARVYASLDLNTGPTPQGVLRQKLETGKATAAEEADRRRAEKREKREAIKAGTEMPKVFTPKTLGVFWGCSEATVRNMIRRGSLPSFSLGGKLVRIRTEDVLAYEERQQVTKANKG